MSRRSRYRDQSAEIANAEGDISNVAGSPPVEPTDKGVSEAGVPNAKGAPKDQFNKANGFVDLPTIDSEGKDVDLSGLDVPGDSFVEQFLSYDGDYAQLPLPEVFNAYPPEVQRKIMEWTDRDVKARRDDESRRRDELMRAEVDRERRWQLFPAIITVLALVCAAVTGVVTANPLFPLVFLLVPLAVIAARVAGDDDSRNRRNKPPRV